MTEIEGLFLHTLNKMDNNKTMYITIYQSGTCVHTQSLD